MTGAWPGRGARPMTSGAPWFGGDHSREAEIEAGEHREAFADDGSAEESYIVRGLERCSDPRCNHERNEHYGRVGAGFAAPRVACTHHGCRCGEFRESGDR